MRTEHIATRLCVSSHGIQCKQRAVHVDIARVGHMLRIKGLEKFIKIVGNFILTAITVIILRRNERIFPSCQESTNDAMGRDVESVSP